MEAKNSIGAAVGILYASYFTFILSALLITRSSSIAGYASNAVVIIIIAAFLLTNLGPLSKKTTFGQLLLFLFTIPVIGLISVVRFDIYSILIFLKIILFVLFFSLANITRQEFCDFLNKTYVAYALLSILFFFNLMPFTLYEKWDHPTMYVDTSFFSYYIFYGLEGGASVMDSYSGLVLIINVFLNKSENRKYYIALSIFFVLWTLKMTPLAGLLVSILGYFFIRNRSVAIVTILTGNIIFSLTIYALVNQIDPFGPELPFWEICYGATHGRSMIWEQQFNIMLKEYQLVNYLVGGYDTATFEVPALQIWGQSTGEYYDNPHNTYLLMLFRSPLLFVVYYIVLVCQAIIRYKRNEFVIVLFILIVCYTNSSIISLQNPVYIFAILFLLVSKQETQHHENTLPASGE